jgi:hypothetical protein
MTHQRARSPRLTCCDQKQGINDKNINPARAQLEALAIKNGLIFHVLAMSAKVPCSLHGGLAYMVLVNASIGRGKAVMGLRHHHMYAPALRPIITHMTTTSRGHGSPVTDGKLLSKS